MDFHVEICDKQIADKRAIPALCCCFPLLLNNAIFRNFAEVSKGGWDGQDVCIFEQPDPIHSHPLDCFC